MSRFLVLAIGALSGCDTVFRLDVVQGLPDGTPGMPCSAMAGHDEDGDTIDDACDVCPGIPDQDQTDTDGDKVGDACDAEPAVIGESLVQFMAFATDMDKEYWSLASGWTPEPDDLVTVGGTMAFMYTPAKAPAYPFELQMGMTLFDVDRSIYNHVQLAGTEGVATMDDCTYDHTTGGGDGWEAEPDAGSRTVLTATYSSGTTFVARARYTSAQLRCQIDGSIRAGNSFTATGTAATAHTQIGSLSIGVNNTKAKLLWFAIYKLP